MKLSLFVQACPARGYIDVGGVSEIRKILIVVQIRKLSAIIREECIHSYYFLTVTAFLLVSPEHLLPLVQCLFNCLYL